LTVATTVSSIAAKTGAERAIRRDEIMTFFLNIGFINIEFPCC
jgi:hypothetical protein